MITPRRDDNPRKETEKERERENGERDTQFKITNARCPEISVRNKKECYITAVKVTL